MSRRIDAFELWCWGRLLRVPWTARRSNQSILKISPRCSLEGLMLKLKLQYFGHLMQRVDSLEKTLMLGGIGGRRGRQILRWLDGITDLDGLESEWTLGVVDGHGGLACCDSWGRKESDTTERLHFLSFSNPLAWQLQTFSLDYYSSSLISTNLLVFACSLFVLHLSHKSCLSKISSMLKNIKLLSARSPDSKTTQSLHYGQTSKL